MADNDILLRFFRNEEDPQIPHRHEDVVCFTDNEMEWHHDFIQWIFPTTQPSVMHPDAPAIDEHFTEQLFADKCAMKNFCKSCQRYLNYMNFECEGDCNIVDSTREIPFYKLPYHNFLRITRVLDSLNQTGHPQCSKAVYEKMFEVMRSGANKKELSFLLNASVEYWRRTQKSAERKIIFLDLDGVMDNGKYDLYLNKYNLPEKDDYGVLFDPDCIAAFKHVIDETKADIVISSSWKSDMSIDEIKRMWKERNLPGMPIDVTPTISRHRGDEIAAWLTLCPDPCRYVIIDDEQREQFNTDQLPYLVTTDGYDGLTMPLADKAIEILNNKNIQQL